MWICDPVVVLGAQHLYFAQMLVEQVLLVLLFDGYLGRFGVVLVEDESNFMGVEPHYVDIQ